MTNTQGVTIPRTGIRDNFRQRAAKLGEALDAEAVQFELLGMCSSERHRLELLDFLFGGVENPKNVHLSIRWPKCHDCRNGKIKPNCPACQLSLGRRNLTLRVFKERLHVSGTVAEELAAAS